MKFRNVLAIILAIFTLSSSISAYADIGGSNMNEEDILIAESEAHYRAMDSKAGEIIEKYDTLINGKNNVDYYELATSMSEETDDRVAAMQMIVNIYDSVNDTEQSYLKSYIESYAPYTDNNELISFCNTLGNDVSISTYASYNGTAAKNYALKHYAKGSFNTNYPDLTQGTDGKIGGDCANFVSQCLLAGGKAMSGDWYIYKKNNLYPIPKTVEQLNNSWRLADPSPWISAKEFNSYWKKNSNKNFEYTTSKYVSDHNSIYYESINTGDVVQFKKKSGFWWQAYHTMIIIECKSSSKDFIMAGHSSSTNNRSLLQACKDNANQKIQIFHIT